MQKNRVNWLDNFKGFAIFSVVLGHVSNLFLDYHMFESYSSVIALSSNIVNTYMMPIFFMIGGYSFALAYCELTTKGKGECVSLNIQRIKVQVINLIIIYFVWSIIYCVSKMTLANDALDKITWETFVFMPFKAVSLFWYIYVLVICYVVTTVALLKKISINKQLLISSVLCFAQYWITYNTLELWTVTKTSMYLVFFVLGLKLKYCDELRRNISRNLFIFSSIVLSSVILITLWYKLYKDCIDVRFIWTDIPIVGTIPTILLVLALTGFFFKRNTIIVFINYIGKYSLEIYLMHRFFMLLCRKCIYVMNIDSCVISYVGCFTISLLLPIAVAEVSKRFGGYNYLFYPKKIFSKYQRFKN